MSVTFTARAVKERCTSEHSKLFGDPYAWEGFEWPTISDGGESYDLTFIGQINCAELAVLDRSELLPKYGMLSFFYDLDGMPERGGGRVLYYTGYLDDLSAMIRTDENGKALAFPELKIFFDGADSDVVCHEMLGEWDNISLLSLSPFETENIRLIFPNNKRLDFYIDRESLKARDFSLAKVRFI